MLTHSLPMIAVIADANFHDTPADFGFAGIEPEGKRMTMRSWSDTRASTRVFNESADVLHAALKEVARRGGMLANRFGREPKGHDGSLPSFLGIFFGALGVFLDRAQRSSHRLTVQLPMIRENIPA